MFEQMNFSLWQTKKDQCFKCLLENILDDFGVNYIKFKFSLKKKQRAQHFVSGFCIERVNFFSNGENSIKNSPGKVFHWVKKSDSLHC